HELAASLRDRRVCAQRRLRKALFLSVGPMYDETVDLARVSESDHEAWIARRKVAPVGMHPPPECASALASELHSCPIGVTLSGKDAQAHPRSLGTDSIQE